MWMFGGTVCGCLEVLYVDVWRYCMWISQIFTSFYNAVVALKCVSVCERVCV
jgi:hypothetical protein